MAINRVPAGFGEVGEAELRPVGRPVELKTEIEQMLRDAGLDGGDLEVADQVIEIASPTVDRDRTLRRVEAALGNVKTARPELARRVADTVTDAHAGEATNRAKAKAKKQQDANAAQRSKDLAADSKAKDGASDWASVLVNISWAVTAVFAVTTLVVLSGAIRWAAHQAKPSNTPSPQDWCQAGTFALACMTVIFALLSALFRKSSGIFSVVISDGKASASLTQFALWTVLIVGGVAYFGGLARFSGAKNAGLSYTIGAGVWPDYLILLGGPAAAGVLAKGLVTYKYDAGTLQSTDASRPMLEQIAKDDAGQSDLVKIQYLAFNVVAMGIFVVGWIMDGQFPEIPALILSLTGGSAALYVAGKAAAKNPPTVTSISPLSAARGGSLTIYGTNFDPSEAAIESRRISVSLLGHSDPLYSDDSSDTSVTVTVPHNMTTGWTKVTVTSTAGVATIPADVKIVGAKAGTAAAAAVADLVPTIGKPPYRSPSKGAATPDDNKKAKGQRRSDDALHARVTSQLRERADADADGKD